MKKKIVDFAFKHKAIKKIALSIHAFNTKIRKKKQERIFVKKSSEVLKSVQECLDTLPFQAFVCFGTLLGLYRDGRVIGRDLDIDIAVMVNSQEDIQKAYEHFIKNGFVVHHSFYINDIGANQHAFYKDGVNVDVGFFFPNGDVNTVYVIYDETKVLSFSIPKVTSFKEFDYRGAKLMLPENAEDVLLHLYGKNWRTPDPHFIYWKCETATLHDDKTGYIVKHDIEEK